MSTVMAISLGAFSLPYASLCIRSLAENLDGDEAIHLLTDTTSDQEQLQQAFAGLGKIKVQLSDELWEDGGNPVETHAQSGTRYSFLQKLGTGQQCWRLRRVDGRDDDGMPVATRGVFMQVVADCIVP